MTAEPNPDRTWHVLASLTGGSGRLVYADTGFVVAIVMGAIDSFFDDAMRFLEAVKSSGARLVISSLALAEAVDVIRKRVKAGHKCADESDGERKVVHAEAARAVRDIDHFITVLVADKMADMYGDITSEQPDLATLYKSMLDLEGRTPQARKGNTYRHEGLGPIDLVHIGMAQLAGARVICTTDKAFAQIGSDKRYGGMEIIILRPR